MTALSTTAVGLAKRCTDQVFGEQTERVFGKDRTGVRWFAEFIAICRKKWPRKTAAQIAVRAEVSQRAAEFWLAGQRQIDVEGARKLIQSEDGFEFLVAFMGDASPRWWKRLQHAQEIEKTRRAIRDQEKRIASLRQEELDF